jgi:hypothetical protein
MPSDKKHLVGGVAWNDFLKKLLQAAQKDSEARRAKIDEQRRTLVVR